MAAGATESRWPPRSPHEALLSSPSGRNKVRQFYNRTSPSPSSSKPSASARRVPALRRAPLPDVSGLEDGDDEDDNDDEETLQLKLQAIEAKLRLKRLQHKQDRTAPSLLNSEDLSTKAIGRKENVPPSQTHPQRQQKRAVHIPASPPKRAIIAPEQRSPGRVLLGIDKGLKGRNVSLRRPAKDQHEHDDPFLSCASAPGHGSLGQPSKGAKSFSERILESRNRDGARLERESHRHAKRSTSFGLHQTDIDASKRKVDEDVVRRERQTHIGDGPDRDGFSRAQILQAIKKSDSGVVKRSKSSKSTLPSQNEPSTKVWMNPNADPEICESRPPAPTKPERSTSPKVKALEEKFEERKDDLSDHLFEPFSTTHLSKRLLTHDLLIRSFKEKSVLRVKDLLSNVKSPDYLLTDHLEADYVVLGIIGAKSSPLTHKDGSRAAAGQDTTSYTEAESSAQNTRGKYMVMQLTDLKWTVDLYLFTTAYTRFYKLTPGTVIAILNPAIMPPPPHKTDTGRFSLTLNSSDDTVLEIGTARDLGWCKATRNDGKQCSDWIDKRHTEFCEFHVDRVIEKNRRGRMEVNGISAPFAPGGRKQGRTGYFDGGAKGTGPRNRARNTLDMTEDGREDGFRKEGQRYDRTTSSKFFVAPSIPGRSAAQLLDREDMMTSRGESKEERVRKRLAEQEKEKEMAKRLGVRGNGAGSQYMRTRQGVDGGNDAAIRDSRVQPQVDTSSLGLLGNMAQEVHLSPIKKMGLKRKALVPTESARKKTRLLTEKGIREPGRESLGGPAMNDDDDGLEIE